MDLSPAERRAEDKLKRRTKKGRPAMKVSGRGMKRFAGGMKKRPDAPSGSGPRPSPEVKRRG